MNELIYFIAGFIGGFICFFTIGLASIDWKKEVDELINTKRINLKIEEKEMEKFYKEVDELIKKYQK